MTLGEAADYLHFFINNLEILFPIQITDDADNCTKTEYANDYHSVIKVK